MYNAFVVLVWECCVGAVGSALPLGQYSPHVYTKSNLFTPDGQFKHWDSTPVLFLSVVYHCVPLPTDVFFDHLCLVIQVAIAVR